MNPWKIQRQNAETLLHILCKTQISNNKNQVFHLTFQNFTFQETETFHSLWAWSPQAGEDYHFYSPCFDDLFCHTESDCDLIQRWWYMVRYIDGTNVFGRFSVLSKSKKSSICILSGKYLAKERISYYLQIKVQLASILRTGTGDFAYFKEKPRVGEVHTRWYDQAMYSLNKCW